MGSAFFGLRKEKSLANIQSSKAARLIPLKREAIVDKMKDGWIVLDPQDLIVDVNPAAEMIIGQPREKMFGQPIQSFLGEFTIPKSLPGGIHELDMRRSIRSQDGFRNMSIRSFSLADREDQAAGHLIILRDDTERRLAEEARQRARDELLVILHAISNAASDAQGLEDFLSESIFQIIHPFRSQSAIFFLIADKRKKDGEPRLSLEAHFGLPPAAIKGLARLPLSSPIFHWVFANRQPLLIEDSNEDARIPAAIDKLEYACFLVLPLITQVGEDKKMLGFLCLGRNEKPVFSQDEIIRLSSITDQVATLIDSGRRRNLAITLLERKRLERDLHDSVSQKLYGLITMTEAAHAAVEAKVDPFDIITKIGEHARQAVKEMRLFLFQVQPLDVEKEGLISVLHHRLAAVEGRANIKARFLAGEKVSLADSLTKDKEIALYFIAQEALNNALRHSGAKSVTVTLKAGRRNVILEIQDDGCGFDPKKVGRGGHGLRNMRERAALINSTITITSRPKKGTRIVITVPKDYIQ